MNNSYRVALIQLNADNQIKANIKNALDLCSKAIERKADVICLPEVFAFRKQNSLDKIPFESIPGPSTLPFMQLAKKQNCFVICGSIYEKASNFKGFNTTVVINPKGEISAIYRKMHLFSLHTDNKNIQESKDFLPGDKPVMTKIKNKSWGLSICYDIRFPELYRTYINAAILNIPASFTKPTGIAHWHTLCKARAIENMAFVCAANQVGKGTGGIETYGHSIIVDPWGNLLAEADGFNPDVITADLDFEAQEKYRNQLPALKHRVL